MQTQQCEKCLSQAVMPVGICLNCGFHNDPLPEQQKNSTSQDTRHGDGSDSTAGTKNTTRNK